MHKHIIYMTILSAIAVIFFHQFASILNALGYTQLLLINTISGWIPKFHYSREIIYVVVLLVLPLFLSLLIAFIYWIINRKELSIFKEILWFAWVISLIIFALYR